MQACGSKKYIYPFPLVCSFVCWWRVRLHLGRTAASRSLNFYFIISAYPMQTSLLRIAPLFLVLSLSLQGCKKPAPPDAPPAPPPAQLAPPQTAPANAVPVSDEDASAAMEKNAASAPPFDYASVPETRSAIPPFPYLTCPAPPSTCPSRCARRPRSRSPRAWM